MDTTYLKVFSALKEEMPFAFSLTADCLLVEEIKPQEIKTKSGLVLAPSTEIRQMDGMEANRPVMVRVLAVGEGYYDKDGDTVPLDSTPGDICLVGKLSVSWLSTFGPIASNANHQLGIMRESEIKLRFHGQEGYDKVSNYLVANLNDTSKFSN